MHIKKIEELIKEKIPVLEFPQEVEVFRTPKEEHQDQAREIDKQKLQFTRGVALVHRSDELPARVGGAPCSHD